MTGVQTCALPISEVTAEGFDKVWAAFEADTTKALEIRPKGTSTGNFTFTGNVWLTAVPMTFDKSSADPVGIDITFEGDGAITKAAQS